MLRSLAFGARAVRSSKVPSVVRNNAKSAYKLGHNKCFQNIVSISRPFSTGVQLFSSKAEKSFLPVLEDEIKVETENAEKAVLPTGFTLKEKKGTKVVIEKKFEDGLRIEVNIELSGSVGPEFDEEELAQHMADGPDGGRPRAQSETQPEGNIECCPEVRIRYEKPSGRALAFTCTLPHDSSVVDQEGEDAIMLPSYSIDTVEMEKQEGYFVYSELFDENVYEHLTALLLERGLDARFQSELKAFCTSEEHNLYRSFLGNLREFLKE